MRHINVGLFVPHIGCPHRCSFCNQRAISGTSRPLTPQEVTAACERAAATMCTPPQNAEIAFFGGSFTAVEPAYQNALLQAAHPFVKAGVFGGIRISTRPDAIDSGVLDRLARYGVTAVELGAQSMNDRVLALNGRGHVAEDVRRASALIHTYDFSLGLQMMTGLPGSDPEDDRRTALELCALGPDSMRIYPTIVVEGTELAVWYRAGRYRPLSLKEAVEQGAQLLQMVEWESGIPVIRMGLHAGGGVQGQYVAGPFHPAFRELCEGRLYRQMALERLNEVLPQGGTARLRVARGAVSKITGQKRENIRWLAQRGYAVTVAGDNDVPVRCVRIDIDTKGRTTQDDTEIAGNPWV